MRHNINQKFYLQTICKDCERLKFKIYQQNNLEYFRDINKKSYRKLNPEVKHILNRTLEEKNREL